MRLVFTLLFLFTGSALWAGGGYEIKVKINGFKEKELYLAYYYGEKQYIKDTAYSNSNGEFIFKGKEALDGGLYLVVLPPDNNFFQIIADKDEQQFSAETDVSDLLKFLEFKGSAKNNILFRDYLRFLNEQRAEMNKLNKELSEAGNNTAKEEDIKKQMGNIQNNVESYQQKLIQKNKGSLPAAIINAGLPVEYPSFSGSEKEMELKKWEYTKQHYFDHIDLTDDRLLRTPTLFPSVAYYIDKLQVQSPDTLNKVIDNLLQRMEPSDEMFKFFLIHFLNKYAKSNIVGMDAVYVHLAKKYYETGRAPWTEEDQLQKIVTNANALEPLLIGKIAPDLNLTKREGGDFQLATYKSPVTVLYFWKDNMKRSYEDLSDLHAFYIKYKSKGVSVLVVALPNGSVSKSWDIVDEKNVADMTHVYTDQYSNIVKIQKDYDLKSLPQIFVLDADKKIILKRVAASQLDEFMENYLK